jgi:hypothetical protein
MIPWNTQTTEAKAMTENRFDNIDCRRAATATRAEYDAHMAKLLARAIPDEAERAEALQTQYPKGLIEAWRELRCRGLFAQVEILERWGELMRVRTIDGVQLWTRRNCDEMAEQLLQAGKLVSPAYWNCKSGFTWAQWQAAEEANRTEATTDAK